MRPKSASVVSFLVLLVFHFTGTWHATTAAADGDDQFIYSGFAGQRLDLDGMAVVEPDGKLMLTNVTSQMKGSAFYPAPIRFHSPATSATNGTAATRSFSTTFVFAIVADYVTVSGNGLAFFVAPSKNLSTASPSQFLGLFNSRNNGYASNHIFAVELDTILNPEFRDINSNHVGVDVNGLVSFAAEPAGYYADDTGDFKNLTLYSGDAMQVWVDYDGPATVVNVTLAPVEAPRPKKPLISVAVDLSPVLNGTAYVGLSSSTGPFHTRHYVLGWSFGIDGAAPPLDYARLPKMPRLPSAKRRSEAHDVILPVAAPILALAVVAGVSLLVWRRFRYAELREDWEVEFGPHRFAYKDLFHATGGFDGKHLLGVGGFGRVYKGVLPAPSKTEVAVKVVSHDAKQGMKQFIAEVVSIGRLRHRNVVQLLGYCRRKGELLLVYDYMPNGSLDTWLYGRNAPPLSWGQRLHAISGVASGLLYLHEDWEQVVVHRDIKASNVLLDGEMNARLGDFGLAKLYDRGGGPGTQTTRVVGTMGYLAPELACTRRVTPATDVFAFGSFVLEVACGRRPIEHGADESKFLADWVLECWHKGHVTDAADARLCGDYDAEEVAAVLKLGLLCSHPAPAGRPSMRQVVQYLDGDALMPEPATTYRSFTTMAMMQNADGFDSYVVPYPLSSATSVGAPSSVLSGER